MCQARPRSGIIVIISSFGIAFHFAAALRAGANGTESVTAGSNQFIPFSGSNIVDMQSFAQPGRVYKKFPSDQPVVPMQPWELSFGIRLEGAPPSVPAVLRLSDPVKNPDIQIVSDVSNLLLQDKLHHNFDPGTRFEIMYTGPLNPFIDPVDFILEPDGFPEIPVRVFLNVIEQPGFPLPVFPDTSADAVVGNITGDEKLEIIVSGAIGFFNEQQGLHAFDSSGNELPGWPFLIDGPDIVGQFIPTPNLADLDGDGIEEVIATDHMIRDVRGGEAEQGNTVSTSLYVIEGSGKVRWQVTADFEEFIIPAVADLNGDGTMEIIVGTETNLARFNADGTPHDGWQVETLNDIHVRVPVVADLDGNPANGMEIIACTPVFGPVPRGQLYVWNEDGTLHGPGWPKEFDKCLDPAVADLDGDPTNGLEIVMAVDFDDDPPIDPKSGFLNKFSVFAWHHDGDDVVGWPYRFLRDPINGFVDDRISFPVSMADVDSDGDLEVFAGTYGHFDPSHGNLFMLHHDGTLDSNWPVWVGIAQLPSNWGGVALGDLDGNGSLEILTGSFRGSFALRNNGQLFDGFPIMTSDNFAQPTIADLDGDGKLEIVQPSLFGRLSVWKMLTSSPVDRPWPLYRQNSRNTGSPEREGDNNVPAVSRFALPFLVLLLMLAGIALHDRLRPAREGKVTE